MSFVPKYQKRRIKTLVNKVETPEESTREATVTNPTLLSAIVPEVSEVSEVPETDPALLLNTLSSVVIPENESEDLEAVIENPIEVLMGVNQGEPVNSEDLEVSESESDVGSEESEELEELEEPQIDIKNVHVYEKTCKDNLKCQKEKCEEIDAIIIDLINEKGKSIESVKKHKAELEEINNHIETCHSSIGKCNGHIKLLTERLESLSNRLEEVSRKKNELQNKIREYKNTENRLKTLKDSIQRHKKVHQVM